MKRFLPGALGSNEPFNHACMGQSCLTDAAQASIVHLSAPSSGGDLQPAPGRLVGAPSSVAALSVMKPGTTPSAPPLPPRGREGRERYRSLPRLLFEPPPPPPPYSVSSRSCMEGKSWLEHRHRTGGSRVRWISTL